MTDPSFPAVVGARLFSPPPLSRNIGWIVDAGRDFPSSIRKDLLALDTRLNIRDTPERLTTRGWNNYGPGDHRAFKYLTPTKRLEAGDLISTGLLVAKTVHLICSPSRAQMVCYELCGLDDHISSAGTRFLWEPVPDLCTPEYRIEMYKTLKLMHIVSPNNAELAGFYGLEDPIDINMPETIVSLATKLVTAGIGPNGTGAVIVRCGKMGCLVSSRNRMDVWLPAYYQPKDEGTKEDGDEVNCTKDGNRNKGGSSPHAKDGDTSHPKVVDPTGGGNAFIGGLAIGLVRNSGNFVLAAAMGTVAASFAIEQIGIPVLSKRRGRELWNGVEVQDRLEEYRKRVEGMGISLG